MCAWKNYDEKPKPSMYDLHTHEIYEIYYFISGHAKYFIEGNIYPLKKGDIIITKKAEACLPNLSTGRTVREACFRRFISNP